MRRDVPLRAAEWIAEALADPDARRGEITDRAAAAVWAMVRCYDETGLGWGGEPDAPGVA